MSQWTELQRKQSDHLVKEFWPQIEAAEAVFDSEVAAAKAELRRGCAVLDPKHGKLFSGTKCKPHRTYRSTFSRAVSKVSRARRKLYAWYGAQFAKIENGTYDVNTVMDKGVEGMESIKVHVTAWEHTASGRWRRATEWTGPDWITRINARLPTSTKDGHIQIFGCPTQTPIAVEMPLSISTPLVRRYDPVGKLRWGKAHRRNGLTDNDFRLLGIE